MIIFIVNINRQSPRKVKEDETNELNNLVKKMGGGGGREILGDGH